MPTSYPPDVARNRVRRLYRAQNAIWLWIAFATVVGTISYFIDPATSNQSATGRTLSGFTELAYYVLLGVGGLVVGWGVWRLDPRAEIIGHLLMGTGVLITSVAIFSLAGFVLSGLTLFGVAVANGSRVYYLWSVAPKRGDENEPA